MPVTRARGEPARIGVLIYDGVEPIDIGGTVGVVSMARRILPAAEAVLIAPEAGPVRLAGGLTVLAQYSMQAAPDCDVMIVCGGPGWPQAAGDPAVRAFLRCLPPSRVASVCTGAMILGAAGLLDGRMATTRRHPAGREETAPLALLGAGGRIRTVAAQVVDAGVVTGGGVTLAIDTTLYTLQRLYGEAAAQEVARVIEYDRAFQANRAALGLRVQD